MLPLDKRLRNRLEKSIKDARDIAEDAAMAALNQLGVKEANPFEYLSSEERVLRRKLRAHGRQLGDFRDSSTKTQETSRLVEEVAYEHWHRMLFARFLAENNLLMYPDPEAPIAVTLEECEDLASEEGARNGWELAARFAARMLPRIFRPDSPVFELVLPPEHEQKLEQLLANLEPEVFTASDSLGWVYQFWQAKRKDQVNASEVKIGARELPAVTQLFTEPYMVSFLLDNSLGAWWAGQRLTREDFATAESESELREKAGLKGVPLEYLRFVKQADETWIPAAGTFDAWPKTLAQLRTLDPCCGSGHFLVAAFLMLVPMRMEMENLSAKDAVDAVLRENINGLEIDQRCVELAAFALALTAWRYPAAGGYRPLPELNLACSGLSISSQKEEWVGLAGDSPDLKIALGELYEQFKDAPILGSLINPELSVGKESLFKRTWEEIRPLLTKALSGEKDDEKTELGVIAQGLSKAAKLLSITYDCIITNPPYLTIKKQSQDLKQYCKKKYPSAKNDIATVFLLRLRDLLTNTGCISIVLPQNWTFQPSYLEFRKKISKDNTMKLIARLGSGAFDSISGEIVKAVLVLLEKKKECRKWYTGVDVTSETNTTKKSRRLIDRPLSKVYVKILTKKNDFRFVLEADSSFSKKLLDKAISMRGIVSGDNEKWTRAFYEIKDLDKWKFYQGTPNKKGFFKGKTNVIDWSCSGHGMLRPGTKNEAYGKKGVAVGQIGRLPGTLYLGELYDNSTGVIVPNEEVNLPSLWAYTYSEDYSIQVREIDQALKVTNATLIKVSFDLDYWTKVAEKKYPNGLPKPYSDDPTQWIFHGHPCGSVFWDAEKKWTASGSFRTDETVLQVAVARLLGYRWPAELDKDMELSDEARSWVGACDELLDLADKDGIVCIPAVRGEMKAEDRLERLLARAFDLDWTLGRKNELLAEVGHRGKSLESWLRDKFFAQHCKLFHHRPFIWHVWDGLNDGFAAFVNYHKLDNKLLETLIYTYLGDWINQQNKNAEKHVDGAEEKLAAAQNLKAKLELILAGEAPHDIFVRWKPIENQAIGWNPDLNDGVRLNIRPFMEVLDVRKKGAGVLRDRPNIKWGKDRGKDVETAPWYPLFKGDRINDHHLSLARKKAAGEKDKEAL